MFAIIEKCSYHYIIYFIYNRSLVKDITKNSTA